jgi:hypothetical protein
LEVIASVRDAAYKKRTESNRDLKAKESEASRLGADAIALATAAPLEAPAVAPLEEAAEAAKTSLGALHYRQEQASAQSRKTASQRARVQELRVRAATARLSAGERTPSPDVESIDLELEASHKRVEQARKVLGEAESALETAKARKALCDLRNATFDEALQESDRLNLQADQLDAALAESAVEPVGAEELAMAERGEADARADLDAARLGAAAHAKALDAAGLASTAAKAAETAKEESARLDAIVKALTEDAPAALLGACDGIPGLGLDGDDVLLDGVRLDALCGAEQVRFCVEVARRANAKSKILVVDGLERLDGEQMDVFVREATRGDYQLIATRVDRGDVVIESLSPDAANDQAAE